MDLESLLIAASAEVESGGLCRLVRMPPRSGTSVQADPPLPEPLGSRLAAMGIAGLWTHQAEALAAAREGRHVVVSTGTASGKSLCFNLPVIEALLTQSKARALYLYPTKSLAQDQLRAIRAFAIPQAVAATYDGDTPSDERALVRRYARIVLSNPDMVHYGLLDNHARWAELLRHLRFVVVDEAHTLRGVFGSHVGCILRRLRRVARHYGSDPLFILTSATIGNPGDLAERLVGVPFVEVTGDGSPKGERLFAFWNPPLKDEAAGSRASANWESARLMATFAGEGNRCIIFTKSRKGAELVARHARHMAPAELSGRIRAYRAGYLASERRELERALFSGELMGVAATSALELGVDVGGLDAVVMNGFPGTVAAVWQQAGRAGRGGQTSAAVLVGQEDPLDQYYLAHPDVLLSKPYEAALVDVTNPRILEPHLGCAASELPIAVDEVAATFGEGAGPVAAGMVERGDLAERAARTPNAVGGQVRLHWRRRERPGRELDLRSLGGRAFSIVDGSTGALMGTVDAARAFGQVHPGAVYLHQGESFVVERLDLAERVAVVEIASPDYYTQARQTSDLTVVATERSGPWAPSGAVLAESRLPSGWCRMRGGPSPAASCWMSSSSTCPNSPWRRWPSGTRFPRTWWPGRRSCPTTCRGRCTPPSMRRSACCRCSPWPTAGISAGCPLCCPSTPACPRCSSTTPTREGWASPSGASPAAPSTWRRRWTWWRTVPASMAARRVCSRRSAATAMIRSTRRERCA